MITQVPTEYSIKGTSWSMSHELQLQALSQMAQEVIRLGSPTFGLAQASPDFALTNNALPFFTQSLNPTNNMQTCIAARWNGTTGPPFPN